MKKKIIIIAVSVLCAAAVIGAALTVRYFRQRNSGDGQHKSSGEYYDPNMLPEWDTNI